MNNMPVFHIYTYIEFGFISLIYFHIAESRVWRRSIIMLASGFLIFSLINLLLFEGIMEFNSNQCYVECLIVFIYCIAFYAQLMRKAENVYLERQPMFWFTSASLLYFSGTLILFLMYNHVSEESFKYYWNVNSVLNLFRNFCYVMVLWLGRKVSIAY